MGACLRVRGFAYALSALSLAACATHPTAAPQDTVARNANVDQRMLMPESGACGGAQVQRYALAATEVFRMPQPQEAPSPALPDDSPRKTLTPTTVCARVILDAQGAVQRAELLNDREDCAAGGEAANADLVQAMLGKVRQWRFAPAALCHFAADRPPTDSQSCQGAQRVEPVPVTLLYAFTFEVEQGRVHVETGGMRGR
jgi:outer membrane PBP1 activator LpoA protein